MTLGFLSTSVKNCITGLGQPTHEIAWSRRKFLRDQPCICFLARGKIPTPSHNGIEAEKESVRDVGLETENEKRVSIGT